MFQNYFHTHHRKSRHSIVPPLNFHKKKTSSQLSTNNDSVTLLSIRFPSVNTSVIDHVEESPPKSIEKVQKKGNFPHIRYKRQPNPEEYLKSMGYSADLRLESEKYEDKVEEKKKKFINKMELFKRQISQLEKYQQEGLVSKRVKNKMKVRMLGEQLKRNRQKEILEREERRNRRKFNSMILSHQ